MKSALVFLLVCFSIITVSGCVWSKWEPILADKSYERPAIDTSAPVTLNEEPASGPLLIPGHYHLKAPKMNDSFLVWVPYDYTPDRSWPVIFSYGGESGASTWLFQQVTRERGFIIIGMNYTKSRSRRRDREWLSQEKEFDVSSCNLDQEETLEILRRESPDVLLLDVMNDTNIHEGLDIARKLLNEPLRKQGKLKVLLLTIFREDDEEIKLALESGLADDIVTKPATSEAIINKIKNITQNQVN